MLVWLYDMFIDNVLIGRIFRKSQFPYFNEISTGETITLIKS